MNKSQDDRVAATRKRKVLDVPSPMAWWVAMAVLLAFAVKLGEPLGLWAGLGLVSGFLLSGSA